MGRLFWKFFFFIWLAQFCASIGVGAWFWWEREQSHHRWEAYRTLHPGQAIPSEFRDHPPPPVHEHRPEDFGRHDGKPPPLPGLGIPPPVLISALIASLFFAALLARYFSKPIQTLSKALTEAASGALSARPGEEMGSRQDELAELGHTFDRMAIQLHSLMDAQRRLLGDVSHELRSPLARIQMATGLAKQQPLRRDVMLERIEKESHHMDALIGELLTLSRLESGSIAVEEELDLPELLQLCIENVRFEWADKPINLLVPHFPKVTVRGDGQLLLRAIENIVRNAVKFAPDNSEIEIKAHATTCACTLQVLDQGPGIPADQLVQIFKPFVRCESPNAPPREGYGLGLAIAQAVIKRMGGKITAHNRDQATGGGLCMEINLPIIQKQS